MNYPNIIGREAEISTLERLYKSKKSEFVAIYGRRRIGKSYLVSEVYGSKIVFSAVGTYVKDGDKNYETYRKLQLDHFYDSLVLSGLDVARRKVLVLGITLGHLSFCLDDELASQTSCLLSECFGSILIEGKLCDAVTVSQVNKRECTQIVNTLHPACQGDVLSYVGETQLAACLGSVHI